MQYITYLEAKDSHKNIKKGFVWDNIPQFAVITGENGSGKSSLLQGIQEGRFLINHGKNPQAIIDLYKSFELQGQGYNSTYADQMQQNEQELLNKHLRSRQDNADGVFMQMKNNARQYPPFLPIVERLSWEDFIKKNFAAFTQDQIHFVNNWRNQLDLNVYRKHFERNEMDEEKFYFSSEEEIKNWISQLKDKNYTSRKTIFDESALNSFFGNYFIAETNLINTVLKNKMKENTPIEPAELKQIIEEKLGKNPIDEVNELLSKVSKYSLHMDFNNNSNPQLICKTQDDISISTKDLSTGEQIIISLYMWRYDKNPLHSTIFLFDEPDAHLNPKMAQMLIDVLKNVIVKEFGCQVIMTTHTLSTVAQCDEGELFYMEDGKIEEIEKIDCMEKLSGGVLIEEMKNILEVVIESSKVVFVEGESDKLHIEKFFQITNCTNPPFRVFDSKSATKMQHYAKAISTLKPTLGNKCLFLCDDDGEGRKAETQVKQYNIKTMLVSQGQKHAGGNFTIENCYDNSLIKACNQNQTSSWSSKTKIQFAQQNFSRNDMRGIQILVDEIKKYLQ